MKKTTHKGIFGLGAVLGMAALPQLAAAASVGNIYEFEVFVINILLQLLVLFWVLAIVCFLWGMVRFIANANDPVRRADGKQFIIWGIVAFLVVFSVWAMARILLYGELGLAAPELRYKDVNGTIY